MHLDLYNSYFDAPWRNLRAYSPKTCPFIHPPVCHSVCLSVTFLFWEYFTTYLKILIKTCTLLESSERKCINYSRKLNFLSFWCIVFIVGHNNPCDKTFKMTRLNLTLTHKWPWTLRSYFWILLDFCYN
jgi:hypothetical protein